VEDVLVCDESQAMHRLRDVPGTDGRPLLSPSPSRPTTITTTTTTRPDQTGPQTSERRKVLM
jgi:hypothetical protein